uniref:Uncharacterized protein n=1 Tax=Lepeophtheirus salmonis TaxID=72036 RepID=A0A0K2TIF5_LEPSM
MKLDSCLLSIFLYFWK